METCPGCRDDFETIDGPTHAYIGACAGCWAVYGTVLAKEYSDVEHFRAHQLTVDAYAAQHPGAQSPQTVRSVGLHLVALCLALERGRNDAQILAERRKLADTSAFVWLTPQPTAYDLTVNDVVRARDADEHRALVRAWAETIWQSWNSHHELVRCWADATGEN